MDLSVKFLTIALLLAAPLIATAQTAPTTRPKAFVMGAEGKPFIPWGFNYDRDFKMRLLEEYWETEWSSVEQDFREMKDLGANVVRIHLQFAQFMDAPDRPNEKNFAQLQKLVRLAESTGLWLDLTGLGCYRKQDVPPWYDDLTEQQRWDAQARFWEEVSRRCADRPGVFCYDLMNEPVAPNEKQPDKQWLHPAAFGGFYFVQYIALDPAGRSRDDMFRAWVAKLCAAIRKHDKHHLITVGMLPFAPGEVARDLDFLSVHVYPQRGKVDDALKITKTFDFGKPVVVEEIFPLSCDIRELEDFITRSRGVGATGWIGFYWGKTPDELRPSTRPADQITLSWLELFQKLDPNRSAASP
jgi:hypothetical protein